MSSTTRPLANSTKSNGKRLDVSSLPRDRVSPLDDPRAIGAALKGGRFGDLWTYRVGDYRVIASVEDDTVRVLVVRVGHRREVYR